MKARSMGLFARGLVMGAADIVPGVSGGTVALMTGIYDRLIRAIVAVDRDCLALLVNGRLSAVWHRIDGMFLLPLSLGILTAIFFRLGRGAARIEELFRRVLALEGLIHQDLKGKVA